MVVQGFSGDVGKVESRERGRQEAPRVVKSRQNGSAARDFREGGSEGVNRNTGSFMLL
jgi:hypothetical protein